MDKKTIFTIFSPTASKIILTLIIIYLTPLIYFIIYFIFAGISIPITDLILTIMPPMSILWLIMISGAILGGDCGPNNGICEGYQLTGGFFILAYIGYTIACIIIYYHDKPKIKSEKSEFDSF